ncbi:MAG: hypothetical protein ACOCP4_07440 [Candidatus Woesearchaeota archaeon]
MEFFSVTLLITFPGLFSKKATKVTSYQVSYTEKGAIENAIDKAKLINPSLEDEDFKVIKSYKMDTGYFQRG